MSRVVIFNLQKIKINNTLAPNAIMLRSKDNAKYLYYLFSTKQAECALNRLSNATTQAKFNKTQIRKMKIISPPDNVQSKIVKNFDEKCAVIESTMENIQA